MGRLLTTEDVRRLHRLTTKRSVAMAIRRGKLKAVKMGRDWFVTERVAKAYRPVRRKSSQK